MLEKTREIIHSFQFLDQARLHQKAFSRERKMGFTKLIAFILNLTRKSLQLELDEFMALLQDDDISITKQSFSEARLKISPDAFKFLFQEVVKAFYKENEVTTFHGYRLLAIDGTTLELPNTEALRIEFGSATNQVDQIARARASGLYDLENNFMVDVIIDRYNCDEKKLAYRHIEKLLEYGLLNDLILFDRGYPSKELIAKLYKAKINFLMRASNYFINEVRQANEADQIVEFKYKGEKYKLRVLRFILDSGEEEILVSSLLDPRFTLDNFKALYFKRWGIETKYNELKHKLEIENFTGIKPIAIRQDFYASMYLSNMAALAKMESDEVIKEQNDDKELKHQYQTNVNLLIGKLKNNLILMMLEPNNNKRVKMYNQIMKEIAQNAVPIRPGRHYLRKKRFNRDRHPMTQKRNL